MEETIETTRTSTAKNIVKFVVGRSVSGVVVTVLHNNCPVEGKAQKAQLYIGAYVVGSMVADAAVDHVITEIDRIRGLVRELKASRKESKEQA
jgi:hypothetical protein